MSNQTIYLDPRSPGAPEAPRSRGRLAIGIVLVIAMVLSAVLQQTAFSYRSAAINRNRPKGAPVPSRLANLDSFSLALLLGGLRGPLVMFLWTSSESQKGDKDLESFDTKVELIRLLQPEFVTVHLFQIWNKVYNISAQLASLSNKYAAILDGIDYAERTLDVLPDDINMVSAIGGVYTEKLGGSSEKDYYRPRVRNETLPIYKVTFPASRIEQLKKAIADAGLELSKVRINQGADGTASALIDKLAGDRVLALFKGADIQVKAVPRQSLRVEARGGRRTEMDTLVNADGYILPEYLKPTHMPAPGAVDNDGSELQYLAQFQPYPYGISPIALGYNYYKRAQMLQRVGLQKHVQLSSLVVDHQPALTLKAWSDEEWDRGRLLEQNGLPAIANADKLPRELRTSNIAPDARIVDRAAIDQAIFSYFQASRVAEAGVIELNEHIAHFPTNIQNFNSNLDTVKATIFLTRADAEYLQAMIAQTPEKRKTSLDQGKADYIEASKWFHILILKYYIDPGDAAVIKYSRTAIDEKMTFAELGDLLARVRAYLNVKYKDPNTNLAVLDLREYEENIRRIDDRLKLIK